MDINGLTLQRDQGRAAPPSAPARVPAPKPPRPGVVELDDANTVEAAVKTIVSESRDKIRSGSRIHVDEATDQFVVEIVNSNNEVIRQIPLEEALRLEVLFQKVTGLIFDQQV